MCEKTERERERRERARERERRKAQVCCVAWHARPVPVEKKSRRVKHIVECFDKLVTS